MVDCILRLRNLGKSFMGCFWRTSVFLTSENYLSTPPTLQNISISGDQILIPEREMRILQYFFFILPFIYV